MNRADAQPDLSVRIFYEDTDATGVVYHANYLKYFERARSIWLEDRGLTHAWLRDRYDLGFVVSRADMRFRAPARLEDRIDVSTTVAELRRASLIFDQAIARQSTPLVQGRFTVACVRLSSFKPCALPAVLAEAV